MVKDFEEKKLKDCTFKPTVSKHAQRMTREKRQIDLNDDAAHDLAQANSKLVERKRAKTTVAPKVDTSSPTKSQSQIVKAEERALYEHSDDGASAKKVQSAVETAVNIVSESLGFAKQESTEDQPQMTARTNKTEKKVNKSDQQFYTYLAYKGLKSVKQLELNKLK